MKTRSTKKITALALALLLTFATGCFAPESENADTETIEKTETVMTKNEKEESSITISETSTSQSEETGSAEAFYMTEITDEIFSRIEGKSFKAECTLPREDLRYLHILHKDLDGAVCEGEMIVNKHIANDVLGIFKELYENGYPIEKVRLIDEYGADDELSMEDNNSSCFNFRFISHTKKISKHGLGLAVDINPLFNPYTKIVDGKRVIEPINGEKYLDRDVDFDYKIERSDICCRLFLAHGFEWGGDWKSVKDYQHFEIPDELIAEWYPDNR